MPASSIRTRPPGGSCSSTLQRDPDVVRSVLEDAAHFPGGHAPAVIAVASVADAFHRQRSVLAVGAQSSLTGGATPMGEVVLTTSRLNHIVEIGADSVRV